MPFTKLKVNMLGRFAILALHCHFGVDRLILAKTNKCLFDQFSTVCLDGDLTWYAEKNAANFHLVTIHHFCLPNESGPRFNVTGNTRCDIV